MTKQTYDLAVLCSLRGRCIAAAGTDYELDSRIWAEFDGRDAYWGPSIYGPRSLLARSRRAPHDQCVVGAVTGPDFWVYDNTLPRVTGSIDAALALADRLFPDAYYILGRGRMRPAEPLYGFQLLTLASKQIAIAEHNSCPIAIVLCAIKGLITKGMADAEGGFGPLCSDCPPVGYPTDKTRCTGCPRRAALAEAQKEGGK